MQYVYITANLKISRSKLYKYFNRNFFGALLGLIWIVRDEIWDAFQNSEEVSVKDKNVIDTRYR